MPYSNGVFHIDLVNGNDAARTALSACVASNPSGTITRINKTAHGLVTGAVVALSSFTTWLNGDWKVTIVDADNFDLDDAVWQATADANGTVTPKGGADWADAWLTITSGATAARIQPGDTLRIAKTADEVSLGQNATWTDNSQTVTLTTAVTKKIEDAISGWTGATHITTGTNPNRKLGGTAVTIAPAGSFTTGKMAYKGIAGGGTQDFSAYTHINFWIRPTSNIALPANTYQIALCSDATGDTPVNTFTIPAIAGSSSWQPVSIDLGGAMGANIQSVAIWAILDPGTTQFSINNIFAANSDLSLKTLIGKTGDVNYNIQSIDDTTIKIDSNNTTATGRGYSGATSTETLYYQVPFDVTTTATYATLSEAGTKETGLNTCTGGWNTSTNLRDGYTVLGNTVVGVGSVFSSLPGWRIENFKFARFSGLGNTGFFTEYNNIVFCGGAGVINTSSLSDMKFNNCSFLNLSGTVTALGTEIYFNNCKFYNFFSQPVTAVAGVVFIASQFANNGTSSMNIGSAGKFGTAAVLLRNCTLSDATEFTFTTNVFSVVYSFNHDNTPGNQWAFHNGGTVNWQTTVFQGSDPGAWRTVTTAATRNSFNPIPIKIAEVACAASALVTVKAWVKKDHATNIGAAIYIEDALYNIAGVVATQTTKADDTDWEELTLTFTPTEAGIVPIFAKTWYIAGNSNSYVGSVTITQA